MIFCSCLEPSTDHQEKGYK